ncbi:MULTISPECIES: hypothetical protein [Aliivibrio]|jgi:hypothetical protein|uniref:Uncharacterized protein n=1 Tax=Aliivibrio sifiae TaxID=566293 RepID=A0A2S7XFQ6_9GAMM|nr:hypothetical protein [Aliivibrio sifiae]PQJ89965.1 hypothetical protein BTO22_10375 [Aliivibrio sifiae]
MLLLDIIPFPLLPYLFYYSCEHLTLIYHSLLELQGTYTFTDKESDDHRDWVVIRVFWLSRCLSVIYAKNAYAGHYFYLFSDAIDTKKHHQLMVLLR